MESRRSRWLGRSAAIVCGLATGAVVVALAASHDSTRETTSHVLPQTRPAVLTPAQNRRRLTPATRARLLTWALRLRRCAAERGTTLGSVKASAKQITIALPPHLARRPTSVLTRLLACSERLGGPPPSSSFTFEAGALRLYLPKTCLLPAGGA